MIRTVSYNTKKSLLWSKNWNLSALHLHLRERGLFGMILYKNQRKSSKMPFLFRLDKLATILQSINFDPIGKVLQIGNHFARYKK